MATNPCPFSLGLTRLHTTLSSSTASNLVESPDEFLIVFTISFNHPSERIRKPLLKLVMRLEHIGHEKVHKRPEFHEIILQWGAGEQ